MFQIDIGRLVGTLDNLENFRQFCIAIHARQIEDPRYFKLALNKQLQNLNYLRSLSDTIGDRFISKQADNIEFMLCGDGVEVKKDRVHITESTAYGIAHVVNEALIIIRNVLDGHLLVGLIPNHALKFSPSSSLFGDQVEEKFPSSVYDIEEAGKCIAIGRYTACVMHLMRALEPALLALQTAVQVDVPKEQWDQIINQIEAKIKEIRKRTHSGGDEQWYSEAASHFRIIKNAWRNHAQHLHERYDEERAVAIYESIRAFMRHLATQLSE
ncbi:hypothetical protein [Sphingobium sp.]|uniref:hypothetical protein n=1 Tax=Sphingobium TaxID=165695 RepID=UPI001A1DCB97|nr:hypothetical protein [Sphingobium sp.]MBJ7377925.1 hypothetical protein [Sphingobium sp.]